MSVWPWMRKVWMIFGGANDSAASSQYNDVFIFDITTSTWSSPPLKSGQLPPVRWCHAAGMVGSIMWTMGGTSGTKYYNDVWKLAVSIGDLPAKPPRGTATQKTASTAAVISELSTTINAKKENALDPIVPLPSKRPNYTPTTAVPSQRIVVNPKIAEKVAPRDLSEQKKTSDRHR